eukprot:gnl/TRDRNA2_/TRDRNA2_191235_c0_seq1.p1 gnl/TRDRNA2_/TRDRNA2_191235_c0~~gnl/TRDRNA2_/TRDRNA2_191235_c0_seq1.p1  ORF type:complete len:133 (-),score=12.55 gnl/TRDRNA2_/TRDRNA2_191235_c0_seq1:127-525(-)
MKQLLLFAGLVLVPAIAESQCTFRACLCDVGTLSCTCGHCRAGWFSTAHQILARTCNVQGGALVGGFIQNDCSVKMNPIPSYNAHSLDWLSSDAANAGQTEVGQQIVKLLGDGKYTTCDCTKPEEARQMEDL